MNRLRGMRVYLSGPMDRCPNGGKLWRNRVTPLLKTLGLTVFDPCNKPISVGKESIENRKVRQRMKEDGDFNLFSTMMREISNVDLRMVDICDFAILYLDLDVFACGSIHEAMLANMQKKPVLVMMKQGKVNVPDWLFGRLDHEEFFSSWDELLAYLSVLDSSSCIPSKRWLFFDKVCLL
jgi:hypothetical protein